MTVPEPFELIAVAHDIASLHNVGAIYRTADGAGCSTVIVSGFTGAPPEPRIAKVALGAELSLATERCATLDELLTRLTGAYVVLAEQDISSVSHDEIDLRALVSVRVDQHGAGAEDHTTRDQSSPDDHVAQPVDGAAREVAVIVCDEINGAPPELRERADVIVELPMAGDKESLNVSVAFGIVMYGVASAARRAGGLPADTNLRSRAPARAVREGVLTRGRTRGELPDR